MVSQEPIKLIVMTQEQLEELLYKVLSNFKQPTPEPQKSLEKLLTYNDVMEIFGIGRVALWRWVKNGELKAIKTGKLVMFEKAEVERYLAIRRGKANKISF